MLGKMRERDDFDVELVDLRDYDLPLFDEVSSNMWIPSQDAWVMRYWPALAKQPPSLPS
jgi:hypothetical protein